MKSLLVFLLCIALAVPQLNAGETQAKKEDQWVVPCVLAVLVLTVGTYAVIKLKRYCETHLTNQPPTIVEAELAADHFGLPRSTPALRHGDTSTNGYFLISSDGSTNWVDLVEFRFTPPGTYMTATAYVNGNEIAARTVPVIECVAYFDFRNLTVPVGKTTLLRTVTRP